MSETSSTAGPLTTLFTPAPNCFTELYKFRDTPNDTVVLASVSTSQCFPSSYTPYGRSVYSPGICQSGYFYTFCQSPAAGAQISSDVTRAHCCPSGYTCPTSTDYGSDMMGAYVLDNCISILSAPATVTFDSVSSTGTLPAGVLVRAYRIEVQWKSGDVSKFATPPPTTYLNAQSSSESFSSSTTTAPATSSSQSTPSPTPPVSSPVSSAESPTIIPSPQSLSDGAKIAIGVTIPIVILLIAAGFFLLYRRSRSKRGAIPAPAPLPELGGNAKYYPELYGNTTQKPAAIYGEKMELDGKQSNSFAQPIHESARPTAELSPDGLAKAPAHYPAYPAQGPVEMSAHNVASTNQTQIHAATENFQASPTTTQPMASLQSLSHPTGTGTPSYDTGLIKDDSAPAVENQAALLEERSRIQRRRELLQQLEQLDSERRERLRMMEELDRDEQAINDRIRGNTG